MAVPSGNIIQERERIYKEIFMGVKTKISWCDASWNPVTGCRHNCPYCYARGIANRFKADEISLCSERNAMNYCVLDDGCVEIDEPIRNREGKVEPYPFGFEPTFYKYRLNIPQEWKKPKNIFVCSMADLFGNWVYETWIDDVFKACEKAPWHNYLFLTKNPIRYIDAVEKGYIPKTDNIWLGATVTTPDTPYLWMDDMHTFLSIEPIQEDFGKMGEQEHRPPEWIIVGAETGNRKDKVVPKRGWIENLYNICRDYGIPLFMKVSLAEVWGEPLVQEFPEELRRQ